MSQGVQTPLAFVKGSNRPPMPDRAVLREKLSMKIPFAHIERLMDLSNKLKRIGKHEKFNIDVGVTERFVNIAKKHNFIVYPPR